MGIDTHYPKQCVSQMILDATYNIEYVYLMIPRGFRYIDQLEHSIEIHCTMAGGSSREILEAARLRLAAAKRQAALATQLM